MQRLLGVWAHRVSTANKSYLAAVMGPSLTRSCRESAEWSISEGVENDTELMTLVKRARAKAPELQTAIEDHIRWVSREIDGGICKEISKFQPYFTLDPDQVADEIDRLVEFVTCVASDRSKQSMYTSLHALQQPEAH